MKDYCPEREDCSSDPSLATPSPWTSEPLLSPPKNTLNLSCPFLPKHQASRRPSPRASQPTAGPVLCDQCPPPSVRIGGDDSTWAGWLTGSRLESLMFKQQPTVVQSEEGSKGKDHQKLK